MKKNSPRKDQGSKLLRQGLTLATGALLLWGLVLDPTPARATLELDRQYGLETVGFLRATDNVDGLFADYVAAAYGDYFSRQSRFVVQDLSKGDTILSHSKTPYSKLIDDPQILSQLARSTRSQTVIRTKVLKEGSQYRFTLEWLHSPKMQVLTAETMVLQEPRDGVALGVSDVQSQIEAALDRMIRKVPWVGHITGRDGQTVTLNIGSGSGLRKGDSLVISTLDDVKRHPLLGTIVDWKLTRTGTVVVDTVDESISFGHVTEENGDLRITRLQKVTQIIPGAEDTRFQMIDDKSEIQRRTQLKPSLGYFKASLWPGGYSRQYSSTTTSTDDRNGGGLFLGAKLDGQLWFTREWFSELGFSYGFWSYTQQLSSGGSNTITGASDVFDFKLDGGYSYLINGDFMGPKAFVKLGYRSDAYSLPSSQTEFVGPITFKSLFLGFGGDLPIRGGWGVDVDFDIGVFNSVFQSGFSDGSTVSTSNVSFSLGGYYRLSNRMTLRAALEVLAQSADFTDSASMSQKIVTFTPSLIYYF